MPPEASYVNDCEAVRAGHRLFQVLRTEGKYGPDYRKHRKLSQGRHQHSDIRNNADVKRSLTKKGGDQ